MQKDEAQNETAVDNYRPVKIHVHAAYHFVIIEDIEIEKGPNKRNAENMLDQKPEET